VRDLLDKKVVDRHGREMGRVDGIILEDGGSGPRRLAAIELGPSTAFRRVRPIFGRWMSGLERALGIDEGRPLRIPFAQILDVADHVKVDVAAGETAAMTLERRLRAIVRAIPGGS
jgi:sporulation protein YlmC with PRC-barrel domain